jgi:hypothetical protein
LHELSATLASIPTLAEQLKLILSTFARIHDARQGLICTYDAGREVLQVAASVGFSPRALEEMREIKGSLGACGLLCVDKMRVVVERVERDARFENCREFA